MHAELLAFVVPIRPVHMLQVCARFARAVRDAGGLLVLGTSLNESKRIELQLRGRAGRQVIRHTENRAQLYVSVCAVCIAMD